MRKFFSRLFHGKESSKQKHQIREDFTQASSSPDAYANKSEHPRVPYCHRTAKDHETSSSSPQPSSATPDQPALTPEAAAAGEESHSQSVEPFKSPGIVPMTAERLAEEAKQYFLEADSADLEHPFLLPAAASASSGASPQQGEEVKSSIRAPVEEEGGTPDAEDAFGVDDDVDDFLGGVLAGKVDEIRQALSKQRLEAAAAAHTAKQEGRPTSVSASAVASPTTSFAQKGSIGAPDEAKRISSTMNNNSSSNAPIDAAIGGAVPRKYVSSAARSLQEYELIAFLGSGTFAEVTLARSHRTGEYFAIKKISKQRVKEEGCVERTFTERKLLANLQHPFLVRLHQAFQSQTHLYLVIDFAQGGDLYYLATQKSWLRSMKRALAKLRYPYYVGRGSAMDEEARLASTMGSEGGEYSSRGGRGGKHSRTLTNVSLSDAMSASRTTPVKGSKMRPSSGEKESAAGTTPGPSLPPPSSVAGDDEDDEVATALEIGKKSGAAASSATAAAKKKKLQASISESPRQGKSKKKNKVRIQTSGEPDVDNPLIDSVEGATLTDVVSSSATMNSSFARKRSSGAMRSSKSSSTAMRATNSTTGGEESTPEVHTARSVTGRRHSWTGASGTPSGKVDVAGPFVPSRMSDSTVTGELPTTVPDDSRFPLRLIAFYAIEIALVLQYLHGEGFLYRDLKPENVLMRGNGHVMLTDFGVAKYRKGAAIGNRTSSDPAAAADGVAEKKKDDRSNSFTGTTHYMSPEMLQGLPHDSRTDWWSFGCLLFEWANGRKAFDAPNQYSLFQSIVERDVSIRDGQDFCPTALELHTRVAQLHYRTEEMKQLVESKLNPEGTGRGGGDGAGTQSDANTVKAELLYNAENRSFDLRLLTPVNRGGDGHTTERAANHITTAAPLTEFLANNSFTSQHSTPFARSMNGSMTAGPGEADPPGGQLISLAGTPNNLSLRLTTMEDGNVAAFLSAVGPGSPGNGRPTPQRFRRISGRTLTSELRDQYLSSATEQLNEANALLQDLIIKLLDRRVEYRLSGENVLEHPFFSCSYVTSQLYYETYFGQMLSREGIQITSNSFAFGHSLGDYNISMGQPLDAQGGSVSQVALGNNSIVRGDEDTVNMAASPQWGGGDASDGGMGFPTSSFVDTMIADTITASMPPNKRPESWRDLFLDMRIRPLFLPRLRTRDDLRYFPCAVTATGLSAAVEQHRRLKEAKEQRRAVAATHRMAAAAMSNASLGAAPANIILPRSMTGEGSAEGNSSPLQAGASTGAMLDDRVTLMPMDAVAAEHLQQLLHSPGVVNPDEMLTAAAGGVASPLPSLLPTSTNMEGENERTPHRPPQGSTAAPSPTTQPPGGPHHDKEEGEDGPALVISTSLTSPVGSSATPERFDPIRSATAAPPKTPERKEDGQERSAPELRGFHYDPLHEVDSTSINANSMTTNAWLDNSVSGRTEHMEETPLHYRGGGRAAEISATSATDDPTASATSPLGKGEDDAVTAEVLERASRLPQSFVDAALAAAAAAKDAVHIRQEGARAAPGSVDHSFAGPAAAAAATLPAVVVTRPPTRNNSIFAAVGPDGTGTVVSRIPTAQNSFASYPNALTSGVTTANTTTSTTVATGEGEGEFSSGSPLFPSRQASTTAPPGSASGAGSPVMFLSEDEGSIGKGPSPGSTATMTPTTAAPPVTPTVPYEGPEIIPAPCGGGYYEQDAMEEVEDLLDDDIAAELGPPGGDGTVEPEAVEGEEPQTTKEEEEAPPAPRISTPLLANDKLALHSALLPAPISLETTQEDEPREKHVEAEKKRDEGEAEGPLLSEDGCVEEAGYDSDKEDSGEEAAEETEESYTGGGDEESSEDTESCESSRSSRSSSNYSTTSTSTSSSSLSSSTRSVDVPHRSFAASAFGFSPGPRSMVMSMDGRPQSPVRGHSGPGASRHRGGGASEFFQSTHSPTSRMGGSAGRMNFPSMGAEGGWRENMSGFGLRGANTSLAGGGGGGIAGLDCDGMPLAESSADYTEQTFNTPLTTLSGIAYRVDEEAASAASLSQLDVGGGAAGTGTQPPLGGNSVGAKSGANAQSKWVQQQRQRVNQYQGPVSSQTANASTSATREGATATPAMSVSPPGKGGQSTSSAPIPRFGVTNTTSNTSKFSPAFGSNNSNHNASSGSGADFAGFTFNERAFGDLLRSNTREEENFDPFGAPAQHTQPSQPPPPRRRMNPRAAFQSRSATDSGDDHSPRQHTSESDGAQSGGGCGTTTASHGSGGNFGADHFQNFSFTSPQILQQLYGRSPSSPYGARFGGSSGAHSEQET